MVTLTTSGSIKARAGENVDAAITATNYDEFIENAEAVLSVLSKFDWVNNWGSVSGSVGAQIIKEGVECYAAIEAVKFDMSGYDSRIEAENIINTLWAKFKTISNIIQTQDFLDWIKNGS